MNINASFGCRKSDWLQAAPFYFLFTLVLIPLIGKLFPSYRIVRVYFFLVRFLECYVQAPALGVCFIVLYFMSPRLSYVMYTTVTFCSQYECFFGVRRSWVQRALLTDGVGLFQF